jgi:hypothetical protein
MAKDYDERKKVGDEVKREGRGNSICSAGESSRRYLVTRQR